MWKRNITVNLPTHFNGRLTIQARDKPSPKSCTGSLVFGLFLRLNLQRHTKLGFILIDTTAHNKSPQGVSVFDRKLRGCQHRQNRLKTTKSLSQKVPLSLRERVGVRASERRARLRKPAAIQVTLTPDTSPAERERGDYGIGPKAICAQKMLR